LEESSKDKDKDKDKDNDDEKKEDKMNDIVENTDLQGSKHLYIVSTSARPISH
jgi:hypothetical protein